MSGFSPHPPLQFDESGAPLSALYGDVYRSRAGAWDEARTVFVEGCGLGETWAGAGVGAAPGGSVGSPSGDSHGSFTILELGFGLGVNFLSTLRAWREARARGGTGARGARLHFVSVEAHPLAADDMRRGLAALGSRGADAVDMAKLLAAWPPPLPGLHRIEFDAAGATLTLAFGDALRTVPSLQLAADAIYLDGFAPSRNPQMWAPPLMKTLARLARPGARLATYSSAPQVRQALHDAGFEIELLPGHGGKRRRLAARYAPRWRSFGAPAAAPAWAAREAIVVGAGLAGAATAAGLARRGWRVTVLERGERAGGGGSSQPLLAEHPHLSPDDNLLARLSRFALLRRQAGRAHGAPPPLGRIELDADAAQTRVRQQMLARLGFPVSFVRAVARDEASDLAGRSLPRGGLWFPDADVVDPAAAIAAWLGTEGSTATDAGDAADAICAADTTGAPDRIELRCRVEAARLQRHGHGWRVLGADGSALAEAPLVVLANAGDAVRLGGLDSVRLQRLCGQSTRVPQRRAGPLRCVLGGDAYAVPLGADLLIGASFDERPDAAPSPAADLDNLRRFAAAVGGDAGQWLPEARTAAFGERFAAIDRLPLIGQLPDEAAARAEAAALLRNDRLTLPRAGGLYAACAFGSRGLLWATLAGELLPALIEGEPLPLERELLRAIDPARFVKRRLREGAHAVSPT